MTECAIFVVLLYLIFATWYLFEGTLYNKMIHLFIYYCILIVTELSVVVVYTLLTGKDPNETMNNSTFDMVGGGLMMLLKGLLCYCVFGKKESASFLNRNREKLSLILIGFIMISSWYLRKCSSGERADTTLLLETAFLFWYVVSSVLVLNGKNKNIWKLRKKAYDSMGTPRQVRDIDQFRHDFSGNIYLMKNLWHYKDYEKLEQIMHSVFGEVENVKLVFEHSNYPVRIVVSHLLQKAANAGISLSVQIEVQEFGMTGEEICTVLYDLVLNGLDRTSALPAKKAYVHLEVLHNDMGYIIQCRNTCMREEKGQLKEQKDMEVVERIIRKYGGTVEKKREKAEWKNINKTEVVIQIPYK
ncbi:ATP-binding protein [[Clostridium] polysaccharolyticum]|uniref:GHKL domain-containing protein n=1 Tax=[Clostridium] polysaccharolyticum TaxID=29364 RepID=UPI000B84B6BE|nr:GHKL domain-containing protein [[Clostridium] polysaccharolyticum]